MSLIGLLKNKREQESLRSNGLNDPGECVIKSRVFWRSL